MAIFGWDISNFDHGRGPVDMKAAVAAGISFATHKIGEGVDYTDPFFARWWGQARGVVPVLGAYYVNHPGNQITQADRFLTLLDQQAPGWREGPFLLQVDAEKFPYMDRAPNLAEIRQFCDRLVERTGGRFRPVVYAPRWLYGDTLRGLGFPLWASAYVNAVGVPFRAAYTGDGDYRWAPYSGQTPAIWQYGSQTRIGSQVTCDANAFRGSVADLISLVYPGGSDVTEEQIVAAVQKALAAPFALAAGPAKRLSSASPPWNTNISAQTLWSYLFEAAVLGGPAGVAGLAAQMTVLSTQLDAVRAVVQSWQAGAVDERALAVELAKIMAAGAAAS